MKSQKAKEQIDRICECNNLDEYAKSLIQNCVELAEDEMMEKAGEAFCIICMSSDVCKNNSVCGKYMEFINQLNTK